MRKSGLKLAAAALLLLVLAGFMGRQRRWARRPVREITEVEEKGTYHYTRHQAMSFTERLNFGKKLGLALLTVAKDHGGQLPSDLAPASEWLATNDIQLPGDLGPDLGVGMASFTLIYKGNLAALQKPDKIILAREKDPVQVHVGRWSRMYVFADGHVNQLEATSGDDFARREKEVWPDQPQ